MEASTATPQSVADHAKRELQECSRVVIFNQAGNILYSSCKASPGELQQLQACFGERDAAIQRGLQLEGRRYEVHRHHPPLVYGRSMADCEPEQSTGIAVCRVERSSVRSGPCYIAVTYEQPHTSAHIVPRLVQFAEQHLEAA